MFVDLVTIVVEEYDPAIAYLVDTLGFELVEDSPAGNRWDLLGPPLA